MKRYLKLLALGLGLSLLLVVSGCNDVKKRADTVDTWQQMIVLYRWAFVKKMASSLDMISI